jgi:hypothetical protein
MADLQTCRSRSPDTAGESVPEPIETVGLLSVEGSAVSGVLMPASPLASMVIGRSARKAAGGVPNDLVIGVGASSLHVIGAG